MSILNFLEIFFSIIKADSTQKSLWKKDPEEKLQSTSLHTQNDNNVVENFLSEQSMRTE